MIDIKKQIFALLKKAPRYKIKIIDNSFESLIDFFRDIDNFFKKEFNYWIQNEKKKKNNRLINSMINQIVPIIEWSENTKIFPAFLPLVIRVVAGLNWEIHNSWEKALEPFKGLRTNRQAIKNIKNKVDNTEKNKFLVPHYPNDSTALIIGISNDMNVDDYNLFYNLLNTFRHYEYSNQKELIAQKKATNSEVSLIKYMISELISNVQEHVSDNKIHLSEIGTYYDDDNIYINFSDAGITIPKKIKAFFKSKKKKWNEKDEYFLEWAFKRYNTTKTDSNGGRGLFDIKTIIKKLKGDLTIISNRSVGRISWDGSDSYYGIPNEINGTIFIFKIPQQNLMKNFKIDLINKDKKIMEVFKND